MTNIKNSSIKTIVWFMCIAYCAIEMLLWSENVISFTLSIRIQSSLCLLSLLLCLPEKGFLKLIFKSPLVIWLIWIVYVGIQGWFLHMDFSAYYRALFTFFNMALVAFMAQRDFRRTLKLLVIALFITTIASLVILPLAINVERDNGNINWSANSTVFLVSSILLLAIVEKWKIGKVLFWCLVPAATILIRASRKSFVAVAIVFFAYAYTYFRTGKIQTKVYATILAAIFIGVFVFLLNNSIVGARLIGTGSSDAYFVSQYASGTFWDKFDERGLMYYYGIQIFKENPVFGIGLNNFKYAFVIELVAHSEYIVQFCECGSVGFLIFLFFYARLFRLLKRRHKMKSESQHTDIYVFILGCLVMVFFLSLSTWLYNVTAWGCFIGLLIGYGSGYFIHN